MTMMMILMLLLQVGSAALSMQLEHYTAEVRGRLV